MADQLKSPSNWNGHRAALVIAHPGHEVLVHGWMEQAHPLVFVLTSGVDDAIATTAKIVAQAGAQRSDMFGRCTDRGLRQAMMMGERDRFHAFVQELADVFLTESIDVVVGDAAEGLDPSHDLCRLLIDAAIELVEPIQPAIRNLEFSLRGTPARPGSYRQLVAGDAWVRKFTSCRSYAEPIVEVQKMLEDEGLDSLRVESLQAVTPWAIGRRHDVLYAGSPERPAGTVRFREHFLPVAGSLQRFVNGRLTPAA